MRLIVYVLLTLGLTHGVSSKGANLEVNDTADKLWNIIYDKSSYPPEEVNKALEASSSLYSVIFESDLNLQLGKIGLIKVGNDICALRLANSRTVDSKKYVDIEYAAVKDKKISNTDIKKSQLYIGKLWGFFHLGFQSGKTKVECENDIRIGWQFPSFLTPWGSEQKAFAISESKNFEDISIDDTLRWYTEQPLGQRKPVKVP